MPDVEYFQRNLFAALKLPRELIRQAKCPHENTRERFGGFTVGELLGVNIHLSIPKALITCLDCGDRYLSPLAERELAKAKEELSQYDRADPTWMTQILKVLGRLRRAWRIG